MDLDSYLRKWHMKNKDKIVKVDKKDFFLSRQVFSVTTYKGQKQNELIDDISKR